MIGCGIYISCGVTKKNKNTGGNDHMCTWNSQNFTATEYFLMDI